MEDINEWIRVADEASNKIRTWGFADYYERRRQMLREGNVRGWARLMKPPFAPGSGYVPELVTLLDGTTKAPTSSTEVILGATQTCARLLREPDRGWRHESVREWRDNLLCNRGAPNLEVLAAATVGGLTRAYLGWGPWRLHRWKRITIIEYVELWLDEWRVSLARGAWTAHLPPPCGGEVLSIAALCFEPPWTWDMSKWQYYMEAELAGDVLLVSSSWRPRECTGPLDAGEKRHLIGSMRRSSPGPSG